MVLIAHRSSSLAFASSHRRRGFRRRAALESGKRHWPKGRAYSRTHYRVMTSGPHMEPQRRLHELFVRQLRNRRLALPHVVGVRRFTSECRRLFARFMSTPQRCLGGATGFQWLESTERGPCDRGWAATVWAPPGLESIAIARTYRTHRAITGYESDEETSQRRRRGER